MQRLTDTLLFLLLAGLIAWAVLQAGEIRQMRIDAQALAVDISALQGQQEALRDEMQQRHNEVLERLSELQEAVEDSGFKPLDIPLDESLQRYTYDLCQRYDVPFEIVIAIGEHESGWQDVGAVIDSNGLPSTGFMQINQPCWDYLARNGIDVHTDAGNIHAGVFLLSELLADMPLEKALVSYQCGRTGAKNIDSTEFSRWILERSLMYR